jgi:tetrapyrrole methylase family protein/MazG family protein
MKSKGRQGATLQDLIRLVRRLRGPRGCPWDREQTAQSIRDYFVDEAYEVAGAIDENSPPRVREELGDLLFQIVFLSEIGRERGEFTLEQVMGEVVEKMIRRHPHVFGSIRVSGSDEVKVNWLKIKEAEGKDAGPSLLSGVPASLPALYRAYRLTRKASKVGFDWEGPAQVFSKIEEEARELKGSLGKGAREKVEHEVGDLLFALVNLARHLDVNPERALRKANGRFVKRFRYVEESLRKEGKKLSQVSLERMDELWEEAKKRESR